MSKNKPYEEQLALLGYNRVSQLDGGCVVQYTYRCPCGKGHIVDTYDTMVTPHEQTVLIMCLDCDSGYSVNRHGCKQWTLMRKGRSFDNG